LEIEELDKVDFMGKSGNSNFRQEPTYIWQNMYFKLWVLMLILAEWLIRKFIELR
jgi:hypothetical protein